MTRMFLNGPTGNLEAFYKKSKISHNAPTVLILHSHSLYGGSMDHPVVSALFDTFVANGFTALKINFRGVENSEGTFDNGIGELIDAAIALDWLEVLNPTTTKFWIAGFSFGAWIALQLLMRRPEITNFLTVAPPVNKYDCSFLSPCPAPGLIIQGESDSFVNKEAVSDFITKTSRYKNCRKIEYNLIPGADHFFRNHIDRLKKVANQYIQSCHGLPEMSSLEKAILLD